MTDRIELANRLLARARLYRDPEQGPEHDHTWALVLEALAVCVASGPSARVAEPTPLAALVVEQLIEDASIAMGLLRKILVHPDDEIPTEWQGYVAINGDRLVIDNAGDLTAKELDLVRRVRSAPSPES